jgi:hypothetical protein
VQTEYEIVINRGRGSESSVVVTDARIGVGEVELGSDRPVSVASHLAMPDSDFGCG